jgi:hypothetical protein
MLAASLTSVFDEMGLSLTVGAQVAFSMASGEAARM